MLLNYKYFAKVYYAIAILVLIILTGTIGFMIVEGWSFFDSFYMTIITVSTVGFNEVHVMLCLFGGLSVLFELFHG